MADPLDRRYRGALRLVPGRGPTIGVVNVVGLEAYLLGVLPGDMPPAWGASAQQALVAGAIAARSSARAKRARAGATYDATADDPLYLGLDGERPATSRAVLGSRGVALVSGQEPLEATIPVAPGAAPVAFAPSPGAPDPVAQAPARPIEGAPADAGPRALELALSQLGVPYVWGGESPRGFDCSGLVYWAYGALGVQLPRVAEDQARIGVPVARGDLRPGDAVFFADSSGYVHHEGLYIGEGRFVHAPHTGEVVRVQRLFDGYYGRQYAGARRYSG
jgi:cell wall-associated NlpC family hydrolase